jgi:hypothetical protein
MEEQAADEAPSPVFPEPSAEPMPTEYTSIKQNASGVAQTIRASRGDRVLLIEKSKDSGTWTVRQAGSKSWDFEASNISDQKKAKDIAERVFEGAFDKDDDKRFTQTDSGSMSYSNEKLAGLWNVAQGESLAATLKATGYYTDGRVLIKAPDKDRDAILASSKKRSGIEGIGREVKVESVIAPTRNTIKPGNEMTVVGYRGGDMSERQVMLKNDSGEVMK